MTVYGKEALKHMTESASFQDVEDIPEDASIHVPHAICVNGMDHTARMIISNKAGAWLFYCHNCSLSGYYRDKEAYTRLVSKTFAEIGPDVKSEEKFTYTYGRQDRTSWPSHVRLWLAQYGMLDDTTPMEYDPLQDRLGIPITNIGALEGWQYRNFKAGAPKYVTRRSQSNKVAAKLAELPYRAGPTVYIVEDLLSMYKVSRAGKNAVALMGTSTHDLTDVLKLFKNVTVWLDNDSAGHTGTMKLLRELDGLVKGKLTTIINRQPKEVPLKILQEYPD
jgi:hypothetical protein